MNLHTSLMNEAGENLMADTGTALARLLLNAVAGLQKKPDESDFALRAQRQFLATGQPQQLRPPPQHRAAITAMLPSGLPLGTPAIAALYDLPPRFPGDCELGYSTFEWTKKEEDP